MARWYNTAIGVMLRIIGAPAFTNFSLDASTDMVGFVFQPSQAGAITHVGFRYGARTGTPPVYQISLQSINATTGLPTGTVLGGGSPASATFTPPADTTWNGTWQWIAIDNSYTPSDSTPLAIVIKYSSGTIDASNFSTFSYGTLNEANTGGLPYSITSTGSWAKFNAIPPYGLRTASNRYGLPIIAATATAVSAPGHRVAVKFTVPSDITSTFQISGFSWMGTLGSAGKSPVVGVWNAAGTALQSVVADTDIARLPITNQFTVWFDHSSLATLIAGTTYYVGIQPADASAGNATIAGHQVSDAADMPALPGGDGYILATWDGSAWTDLTTIRPVAEVAIYDMTQAAGGGSNTGVILAGQVAPGVMAF